MLSKIINLKDFADQNNIRLEDHKVIGDEASRIITDKFKYNKEQIKTHFDSLLDETQLEIYSVYLNYERKYGEKVFNVFINHLINTKELTSLSEAGKVLGKYFKVFDSFFLSIAQSRKARAGKSFETIHNALFKKLDYPFDEQKVINGKPDFLMPSFKHFKNNPIDCIIFTAKRTLRERWRQIVTEGTRGLGFYLATIDEEISSNQLMEAHNNRIYIVCPERIKKKFYTDKINVLSFTQFFKDHLDPAMKRWKRNNVIK